MSRIGCSTSIDLLGPYGGPGQIFYETYIRNMHGGSLHREPCGTVDLKVCTGPFADEDEASSQRRESLFILFECKDVDALLQKLNVLGIKRHISGWTEYRRVIVCDYQSLPESMRDRAREAAAQDDGWRGFFEQGVAQVPEKFSVSQRQMVRAVGTPSPLSSEIPPR